MALTAPPVEGQANRALCEFIAKAMGVRKGNVTVKGGERSREKTLAVEGVSLRSVRERLSLRTPNENESRNENEGPKGRGEKEERG